MIGIRLTVIPTFSKTCVRISPTTPKTTRLEKGSVARPMIDCIEETAIPVCMVGLLYALPNAFYTRVEQHNDAAKAIEAAGFATPEQEAALAALRAEVEANSDYVGLNFVAEARAMHEGTVRERSIYGEARPDEAIKLLEEGVPVAPLPFMPSRKTN